MTDEVKQEAADYYKSMFETACREAVKQVWENGRFKKQGKYRIMKPADGSAGVGRGLQLLFLRDFGADGYSGFSGSQTSGAGGCDDGAETAGGAAFAG